MADETKTETEAGPAAAPAAVPPDAVLYPAGWHPGPGNLGPVEAREAYLRGVLGGDVHTRDCGFGRKLATRSANDTLYFATDHPLAGRDRYDWGPDEPSGCRHGRLKPEAK